MRQLKITHQITVRESKSITSYFNDINKYDLIQPEEDVPDWVRRGAERTYPENVLPFEAEAMWAMYVEHKSLDALEVCAGPGKMWEHYSPTPLTREWLEEEGFIKNES